jgi:hypothetical protein
MNGQNGQQQYDNQYKWAQFSARLDDDSRERRTDGGDGVNAAARFDDVEVSTPRRGATATREFERRRLANVVRFQDHRPVPAAASAAAVVVSEKPRPAERPRTRSERRAADEAAEREVTAPAPAPMPKPAPKRVQRNDYWVTRDDQRRISARIFKTTFQQQRDDAE